MHILHNGFTENGVFYKQKCLPEKMNQISDDEDIQNSEGD